MDSKSYIEAAMRTESANYASEPISGDLARILRLYEGLTVVLDMYKKHLYYGVAVDSTMVGNFKTYASYIVDESTGDETFENVNYRLLHGLIGIATENGEMFTELLSASRDGRELDVVNLKEEMGDISWYEAILFDELGSTWEEVREKNIAKLKARYPEKFTTENAMNRDLETERKILES